MPQMRQNRSLSDADLLARCFGATYPPRFSVGTHSHSWDQFTSAEEGVMRVISGGIAWIVPPRHGLWVPAGLEHDLVSYGALALRTLYFHPGTIPHRDVKCHAMEVSPLLQELVLHTVRRGRLRAVDPHESHCFDLLCDLIPIQRPASIQLPLPRDDRGQRVAQRLIDDPGARDEISKLASASGASRRTLERIFLAETGMTVGRWRRRLRILASLELLAEGTPVSLVANRIGYTSTSGFIARFKEVFGVTPSQYGLGPNVTASTIL